MRWWSFNLNQGLLNPYTLSIIFMYLYPASPANIVPALATAKGLLPTRSLPISVPSYPSTTQGHPPTRASPVSIPASRLPALIPDVPLTHTTWLSCSIASSLFPTIFPPKSLYAASLLPLGTTMRPSCVLPPCSPSPLQTLQKSAAVPPTVPRLPVVSLCRLYPAEFLTLTAPLTLISGDTSANQTEKQQSKQ